MGHPPTFHSFPNKCGKHEKQNVDFAKRVTLLARPTFLHVNNKIFGLPSWVTSVKMKESEHVCALFKTIRACAKAVGLGKGVNFFLI